MKKTLLKIKYENILLMLFIPLAIIQFVKANIDFKLVSIISSLVLYGGVCIVIKMTRLEALESVRNEIETPILEPILKYLNAYVISFRQIKKEVIKQARYINDQAYILRASFNK